MTKEEAGIALVVAGIISLILGNLALGVFFIFIALLL
jgi:hypothetical protein